MSVEGFDKILDKSANDLLQEYNIDDLNKLVFKLGSDIDTKKQTLKLLVGHKYRDLLNVADDIIKMNDITILANNELMDLTFKKSNYNIKSLANESKLNQSMENDNLRTIQRKNRPIVLKNIVHSLNYSLISLKKLLNQESEAQIQNSSSAYDDYLKVEITTDIDDTLDTYQPVTGTVLNDFIVLSKLIYLVRHFFKTEIERESDTFPIIKFKQLCIEFNSLMESQVKRLMHQSDSEFILHLAITYMFSNGCIIGHSIEWILKQRLDYLSYLVNTNISFQHLFNYVYKTLEYVNVIGSRISNLINRLKSNTGSLSWIQQTCLKQWTYWFYEEETNSDSFVEDHLQEDLEKIQSSVDSGQLKSSIANWKAAIVEQLLCNFNIRLSEVSNHLSGLVILLKSTLLAFKHFTSLAELSINGSKLILFIIDKWIESFFRLLDLNFRDFRNVDKTIIDIFNDEKLIMSHSKSDPSIYEFSENVDIDTLVSLHFNKENDTKVSLDANIILSSLSSFKMGLKNSNTCVESIKNIRSLILKPVISVDEYENDELWMQISRHLKSMFTTNLNKSVTILNELITTFFKKVEEILNGNDNLNKLKVFFLIRVLSRIEEQIEVDELYERFNQYLDESIDRVNVNKLSERLLEICFEKLYTITYETHSKKLDEILGSRGQVGELENYPEIMLWDSNSKNEKIPTICSIEYSKFLLDFCHDLIIDQGKDYLNLFSLNSFNKVRNEILSVFLETIECFFTENKDHFKSTEVMLLFYSDYLFTLYLKDSAYIEENDKLSQIIAKLSEEHKTQISSAILENYQTQFLLYYPLSK